MVPRRHRIRRRGRCAVSMDIPRAHLARWLRLGGLLLSAAAIVWIALRFVRTGALETLQRAPVSLSSLIVALLAGAIAYALAMCLPTLAWWRLMRAFSIRRIAFQAVFPTYAVSQYGKYLPGNFAHYALRHAWSRRYEIAHAELGLASILEAALLVFAALGMTLLADTRQLRLISSIDPIIAIALVFASVALLGLALQWARGRRLFGAVVPNLPSLSALIFCIVCYAIFLFGSAALMRGLASALAFHVDSFAMLLAASAASWLAGFVVIGAPGGLGVREATFVALAGASLGESEALLLIGLFRVVTFLGDTLFFAAGVLIARARNRDHANPSDHPSSTSGTSP